ncbi:S-phase kinase-associated protein 1-like [Contarinia nasturtii]|uniref:S-phase kinase-associated protein 1-like n=1 Tax=Contarinia nasturtii TaxID=265458 RepID=UPI0012D40E5F|nr:S-phase kinase-associated protein 1-like [Contarinia nasturtii]
MPVIRLQSSDGEVFNVETNVAKVSGTIKTMLEDCGMEEEDDTTVPLQNVDSNILGRVLEWAKHHQNDPIPTDDDDNKVKRTDDIPAWDVDFLNVEQGILFELILAANYLDIKGLMDSACKTVANMIKGKKPEEIRRTFDIPNDYTAEEREQIAKEDKWCIEI